MKFFTRLSPLTTSLFAFSVAVCLAFWGLAALTASADEGGAGAWGYSENPAACDYLELPGGPDYICADWIVHGETQVTCCIEARDLRGGNREACIAVLPTTTERPGL